MQTERRPFSAVIGAAAVVLVGFGGQAVRAEAPLSAIDWLSQSVDHPRVLPAASATPAPIPAAPAAAAPAGQPPTARTALPQSVTTAPIGAASPDGVGLLPPRITGLPAALWGPGQSAEIARAVTAARTDALPALQGLLVMLLLAEARPPADSGPDGLLLLARIDKLLSFGALEQAQALIKAAGPGSSAELFRRGFDVALLTGEEDEACALMAKAPHLSPALTARIFCLARAGDWSAAALTYDTARALGQVPAAEEALLERFLDDGLADGADPLPPPGSPTPLIWRMQEAIGEPLPTTGLPLAFAQADLSPQTGWKAQLEAAERLARAGALSPNRLLGLYTERSPAASGGIWDRVAAFQEFDNALQSADPDRVAMALPLAWDAMEAVELEVPFARLFADRLGQITLSGEAARLAFRIRLLAPGYEGAARAAVPDDPQAAFLAALARGDLTGVQPPDAMARAIAPAFLDPVPDATATALQAEGRLGEALLTAIDRIARGVQGEPRGVADGLAFLREVGLEDVARRTALELLILERRG